MHPHKLGLSAALEGASQLPPFPKRSPHPLPITLSTISFDLLNLIQAPPYSKLQEDRACTVQTGAGPARGRHELLDTTQGGVWQLPEGSERPNGALISGCQEKAFDMMSVKELTRKRLIPIS